MDVVMYNDSGMPRRIGRVEQISDHGSMRIGLKFTDPEAFYFINDIPDHLELILHPKPVAPVKKPEEFGNIWDRLLKESMRVDEAGRQEQQHIAAEGFQEKAKRLVLEYILSKLEKTDTSPTFQVYVVWFSKTLQNWKAMVSTTLPDQMYYEVTYNGDKKETYLDVYKKWDNVCVPDEGRVTPKDDPYLGKGVRVTGSTGTQIGHGNTQSNVFG